MRLTVSRRFSFSASHRLGVPGWSDDQNRSTFGREADGRYGHGHNFVANFGFKGEVDRRTGMMVNLAEIKTRVRGLLERRFDHRFLNGDTPPFDRINPTTENLALALLEEARALFTDSPAQPVVCHLSESASSEATAFSNGSVERHLWIDFSAARRTHVPGLTDEQNRDLFGRAASPAGHGHHYRLRATWSGQPDQRTGQLIDEAAARQSLDRLRDELDHRNLSVELDAFKAQPNTTEVLAGLLFDRLHAASSASRVTLHENPAFAVEHSQTGETRMIVRSGFTAAHRLHSPHLSAAENQDIYSKCNNPAGHGHDYRVACTVTGPLDSRTGRVADLVGLNRELDGVLDDWRYRHLDQEVAEFTDQPSTGENIVRLLWAKLEPRLAHQLIRLRLWETDNNRFTLRR